MQNDKFQKDKALPFAECRYSQSSQSSFKAHMHAAFSIGAVDKGKVEYTVGNHTTTLSAGSLALVNPETLHSCNTLSGKGRSYFMLYLDTNWCMTLQKSLWKIENHIEFMTTRLDDEPMYQRYCSTMHALFNTTTHIQEKEELLVDLVTTVFLRSCKPQLLTKRAPEGIERLKSILRNDLSRDFTLDSLAADLGVNPYTLLRGFKSETGITPHAFRMNCRIEKAKELLRQGKDIADTAYECGFFDQSHLHRHFKSMTTVTPQEYRINFVQ